MMTAMGLEDANRMASYRRPYHSSSSKSPASHDGLALTPKKTTNPPPHQDLVRYLDYNYTSPHETKSIKLAPSKRRSLSNQGGLLNRMFGNSGSNDPASTKDDPSTSPDSSKPSDLSLVTEESHAGQGLQKRNSLGGAINRKKDDESSPVTEKKRRSSSVANAISKARNSLHLSSNHNSSSNESKAETPLQKLGRTDPALAVPHGPNNNSAGESMPTSRSSFRVGVTEDKNKKCRRTMEDTHSYLYNFLGTPAPSLPIESSSNSKKSLDGKDTDADSNSDASTHVVETDNGYFAIFDGHAGTFAADWCGKKLHVILEDCIRRNPNMAIPELLDMTYTTVDQQLEKLPLKNSGCTAITAVLRWEDRVPNSQSATGSSAVAPQTALAMKVLTDTKSEPTDISDTPTQTTPVVAKAASTGNPAAAATTVQESSCRQRVLYTANVGDARIVLCRNGKALRLSYDHKGSDENEGKRISNAGGLILNNRVNGVLAVTRALGDAYLKDLVTGHPYTTETVIQPDIDEFLILACDGLWDVCSDQEAVDLIRHTQDPQVASKQLVDHALARFSTDNLSCMVIRFDTKTLQSHAAHKAPPIGVEGDPPFKKRGGISEVDALVQEARKSIKRDRDLDYGPSGNIEAISSKESQESKESRDSKEKLKEGMIKEEDEEEEDEEEEEPGPELDLAGGRDLPSNISGAGARELALKKNRGS